MGSQSLLSLVFVLSSLLQLSAANTEKTIFTAPQVSSLVSLRTPFPDRGALSPKQSLLRTSLPIAFPTASSPRGVEFWLPLYQLKERARYEVRLCWAATAPTDFWLKAFTASELLELGLASAENVETEKQPSMYLQILGAATYYTSNQTLMKDPVPVLVDLILDEYLLGILPASLLNVGVFILMTAAVAWYAGTYITRWLAKGLLPTPIKLKGF